VAKESRIPSVHALFFNPDMEQISPTAPLMHQQPWLFARLCPVRVSVKKFVRLSAMTLSFDGKPRG
jgi:hypothetical protein